MNLLHSASYYSVATAMLGFTLLTSPFAPSTLSRPQFQPKTSQQPFRAAGWHVLRSPAP